MGRLIEVIGRPAAIEARDAYYGRLGNTTSRQAVSLVGGQSVRNERIRPNSFGSRFALDFRPIFNPNTPRERAHIARNAYVSSRRREAYVGEIDRVLRKAITAVLPHARLINDSADAAPIIEALRAGRQLENEVMLLVGAVGCGKSTFVDYLCEVRLPTEVSDSTQWVRLNLNNAPDDRNMLEGWILEQLGQTLRRNHPDIDFPSREVLDLVFGNELADLRRGALARLDPTSDRYEELVATKLLEWTSDKVTYVRALVKYLCANRGKLLVMVFDNCDKRDRDVQLRTFDAARWIQSIVRCLIILPIRDITYRAYSDVPPLDTKIKDLVFRIEPPPFSDVLLKRMELVLTQLNATSSDRRLTFKWPNGYKVSYPASDLGQYVASIFYSLYRHDRLIRGLLVGLAGRNIRKAMEIFLEFCRSGHIAEHEFSKIRQAKGQYGLPRQIVTRVLLRRDRRYYDGDDSFVKNLFQCVPKDTAPDHLVRLTILIWLERHFRIMGPSGVEGFHPCRQLILDLAVFGHDAHRVRSEVEYLVREHCIVTEHQRSLLESDDDLLALSPAGHVHLGLVSNPTYIAACAEDTWVKDSCLAEQIAERIGHFGPSVHYSPEITAANTRDFLRYLRDFAKDRYQSASRYIDNRYLNDPCSSLDDVTADADRQIQKMPCVAGWHVPDPRFMVNTECDGEIVSVKEYGLFVKLDAGPTGLVHVSTIPGGRVTDAHAPGRRVRVRIDRIERDAGKASLKLLAII